MTFGRQMGTDARVTVSKPIATMPPTITLLVMLALTGGAAAVLEVNPMDPVVLDGDNLTLTCTASRPTAEPLFWSVCHFMFNCSSITLDHTVEAVDNATSVLRLPALRMPQEEEVNAEGRIFQCHFEWPFNMRNYQIAAAAKVFIGVPPFPVANLQCASRDKVHFNCSWQQQGYTGLSSKKTYFQYRQKLDGGDWRSVVLEEGVNQFTGTAFPYTMEIRVTQSNALGNSTYSMINFSALTGTIPNRPEGVSLGFTREGDDVISMQMSWGLPREWTEPASLLEYKVDYKDSKSGKYTTIPRITETDRRYNVPDVRPHTTYTVRVKCKLGGADSWSEWSTPVAELSLETAPSGEVMELDISTLNTNQNPYGRDILLAWQPPRLEDRHGVIRGYLLFVSPSPLPQPINTSDPSYQLSDLDKFRSYDVRVAAYTMEGAVGPYKAIEIPDMTTAPAKVENFKAMSETSDTILVAWNRTANPHGVVSGYTVKWNELDQSSNIHVSELDGVATQHQLTNLRPNTQYNISIVVRNKEGQSRPVIGIATTHFASPTQPLNLLLHKSSSTKLSLAWDDPEAWNGPPHGFEIHYRPTGAPRHESVNKSVSVNRAPLTINCSAWEEPVPFTFLVFASTGTGEVDKLLGEPAILEREMCGPNYSMTGIIIGVLTAAFCVMCLILCLFTVKRSPMMKPSPDPYFIDGILGPPSDKFKINSRLATRRQEKEDYDVLKTCESVRVLIGQRSEPGSNKGSMSSSTGSSSDQGFHEMAPDAPIIAQYSNIGLEATPGGDGKPYTRCSSGYGHSLRSQSEQDLLQKQRMLSTSGEYAEDVFECPEDMDAGPLGEFVNSYQTVPGARVPTGAKESRPRSAPPVDAEGALGMDYCQMGVKFPLPVPTSRAKEAGSTSPLGGQDVMDEADISYTQVALEDTQSHKEEPSRLYHSVWPPTPENPDPKADQPDDPSWTGGFVTDLGFNNNSKEIPNVHAAEGLFTAPPQEIVVATARDGGPSIPRLSSVDSEDYIDIVGGNSSPRANAPMLSSSSPTHFALPLKSLCSNGDISCQDYVTQCELPPASPVENMV